MQTENDQRPRTFARSAGPWVGINVLLSSPKAQGCILFVVGQELTSLAQPGTIRHELQGDRANLIMRNDCIAASPWARLNCFSFGPLLTLTTGAGSLEPLKSSPATCEPTNR